jgi:hypothetical protein
VRVPCKALDRFKEELAPCQSHDDLCSLPL